MLLASLFYLLQPAYAETKYILNIHYEYEPNLNIKFEGYSENTDELVAASESKKDADLKYVDYVNRNNITVIDSSAEAPIVTFGNNGKNTEIYQTYNINQYDVKELICIVTPDHPSNFIRKPENTPVTFCKSDSRIFSIRGWHVFNQYGYGRTISIKKFNGNGSNGLYVIADLYDYKLIKPKKVIAQVYGVIQ